MLPKGEEVRTLFAAVRLGAVRLRAVRTVDQSCSCTLGELEPVHQVKRSSSRFNMFGAVRLRAVWAAPHELFVHSERIRAAMQGVYILDLRRNYCNELVF